jgi:hypothetical protein
LVCGWRSVELLDLIVREWSRPRIFRFLWRYDALNPVKKIAKDASVSACSCG